MGWFSAFRTIRRYWKMAHDPRTPKAVRYIIYGGVAFSLVPDDWLPDWIPGLGLIDEAAVIPGVIAASMLLIPQEVKNDTLQEDEAKVERNRKAGAHYNPPLETAGVA